MLVSLVEEVRPNRFIVRPKLQLGCVDCSFDVFTRDATSDGSRGEVSANLIMINGKEKKNKLMRCRNSLKLTSLNFRKSYSS